MSAKAETRMQQVVSSSAQWPLSKVLIAGVIAIVGSILANMIVRAIGLALIGAQPDFDPLATFGPVVIFSVMFIAVATLIFLLITRVSRSVTRTWTVVALLGLVVGLIPDIMLLVSPEAMPLGTVTTGGVLVLIAMHVVSGIITWWALPRFARA